MSIVEQIVHLEELSSIDEDIRRLDERLDKEHREAEGRAKELRELEERIGADREMLTAMDRTRADLAIEIRQMTQQAERSREKLGRSRNEKEQNAAQREIEEVRKLLRDRELEHERLATQIEAAKATIQEAESRRDGVMALIAGEASGSSALIATLNAERAGKLELRAVSLGRIPVVLFRRYESIRTKRVIAIARTHDGTCSGCHMAVPPMMFQKMRRREQFEQCPSCRRILYYYPVEAPTTSEAQRD